MLPAKQRLEADDVTGGQVDLRLEHEPELVSRERVVQFELEQPQRHPALVQLGADELQRLLAPAMPRSAAPSTAASSAAAFGAVLRKHRDARGHA